MFSDAYICPWCKADLKSKEIPFMTKSYYPKKDTHFTQAIELINVGWEHEECNCRWQYNGELIRDGIPELKDKYKTEETKDKSVVAENTTTENNNLNNESEENPNV